MKRNFWSSRVPTDVQTDVQKSVPTSVLTGLLTVLLIGLLVGCGNPRSQTAPDFQQGDELVGIIGGKDATGNEDFSKTIVAIYDVYQGGLCTGSLIGDNMVVTAAHCIGALDDLRVIFGTDLEKENLEVRGVEAVVISPLWKTRQWEELDNGDIAVLKFSGSLPAGYQAAKVLTDTSKLAPGSSVMLAGYGISDGRKGTGSGKLRYVDVEVKSDKFSKTEILLDQTKGRGACHGDSGGPAYVKVGGELLLWGVTSRGVADLRDDCSRYSAYTNMVPYQAWIGKTVEALAKAKAPAARPKPSLVWGSLLDALPH